MKINKYIEVVGSSNSRLNAMNKKSRIDVVSALEKRYTRVEITLVDNMRDLEILVAKKPDLVVLGMKLILLEPEKGYDDSTKLWLPDYLAEHGIDFTGSETNALRLENNKPGAKQHVLNAGLRSSAYFISTIKEPTFTHELTFPLFVKPSNRGGSKGIDENSVVHTQAELVAKITFIHSEYSSDALVEEYLSGREFSVAVTEDAVTGDLVAMPMEIVSPIDSNGNSYLSAAIKKADSEHVAFVADSAVKSVISDFAIDVFKSLGGRDYGRIDVRLNAIGNPCFIEANFIPGLSHHGYLSRCFFLNRQMNYDEMMFSIVDLGLKRPAHLLPITTLDTDTLFAAPELVNIPA